jgi:hypothetical protein
LISLTKTPEEEEEEEGRIPIAVALLWFAKWETA